MQEIWLPSNTPQSKAVGRFVDRDHEYTDRHGEKHIRTVTVLEHKFPGSQDVSTSLCKDNADGMKLRKEWSQAWALYEKQKAAAVGAPPVPTATEYGIAGTPIETADFLGKDFISRLKLMGFLTLEQLADMSDATCNNVGFGARDWRKKAKQYLDGKSKAPAVDHGSAVADLMRVVEEQKAMIAALMAERTVTVTAPADDSRDMQVQDHIEREAAKPRSRRKAAEAQPEA